MIEITEEELRLLPGPNQILGEWKMYLRFLKDYFKAHGIANPIIVEIGTQYGAQKLHYQKFFDAEHIGIDIDEKNSKPDILGDSHNPKTVTALKKILVGRLINVLFLDGAHTYKDTLMDYWAYGSLTKDIIAFHDIRHEKEIGQLWKDLQESERENKDLAFYKIGAWGGGWCELGIGLLVKRREGELQSQI